MSARRDTLRQKLGHPIIDGDGHILECEPVVLDYVRRYAGAEGIAT